MPDGVRLNGRAVLSKLIREFNNETKQHLKILSGNKVESDIENSLDNENQPQQLHQFHKNDKQSLQKQRLEKMVAIPFNSNVKTISNCGQINLDFANWTLEYKIENGTNKCDMFLQKHAIMIETSVLKEMPSPFSYPFPEMLYIQGKVAKTKKVLTNITLQDGKRLFTAYHSKQKRSEIRKEQFKTMYRLLEMKKVVTKIYKFATNPKQNLKPNHKNKSDRARKKSNDNQKNNQISDTSSLDYFLDPPLNTPINSNQTLIFSNEIQFYGCESNTPSCIGQVLNSKPFFIHLEKHTPPCCMEKLQLVFHHVIDELDNVGIRYWLDNAALKSAIETNSLSLDAFEIDISFNIFDLSRSNSLKKSQTRPFTDDKGFYWIKATDGQYYKVQYSKINNIGINLLPFELNGEYVRPNGFYGWKAKEFSVEFLHPMSTVLFLGKNIMCPNNVNEFLEIKQNF